MIDRLRVDTITVGQLWNHNKRAAIVLHRANRWTIWLLRFFPLLHVITTTAALAVTVIVDRQTATIEWIAQHGAVSRAHDVAMLIMFGVQILGYERLIARVRQIVFRGAYAHVLRAGRTAAKATEELVEHVEVLDGQL